MHNSTPYISTKYPAGKTTRRFHKHILALFTMLATLCCLTAGATELQYTNEFWISTNASGANLGTLDNPFNAPTAAAFDQIMNGSYSSIIPPNSTIHLMAGIYYTDGTGLLKSGWRVLGSGIDITIIRLETNGINGIVFGCNTGIILTNFELCDLTVDGNQTGTPTKDVDGVELLGGDIAIRRIKVINVGSYSAETHGISIVPDSPDSKGNVIEDCEVSSVYDAANDIDAISLDGGSGIIRDNKIYLPNAGFGFNGEGTHDYLIEGNYVYGAGQGFHLDTGGTSNLTIINNSFIDCYNIAYIGDSGLYAPNKNITFAFNNASLLPYEDAIQAFLFTGIFSYTNIFIFGNNVSIDGAPASSNNEFVYAQNVAGLTIANNSFDEHLTNLIFSTCYNVSMYNNSDLYGDYLSDANIPTIGDTVVSPLGLILLGSTASSQVLTNLGLPSNVADVITNNSAQAVTLNNNLTVNGGATVSGNVGIGTSSPSQTLSVNGNENVAGSLAIGVAAPNCAITVASANSTVGEFLSSNPGISAIRFGDINVNHLAYFGLLKGLTDQFAFLNGYSETNDPMMVIDSNVRGDGNVGDGNIGIGTNMPSQRLTVSGNVLVVGTNSASYLAGDMSQGSNYNAAKLTGTEPVAVLNPIVSTNQAFFILPPDAVIYANGIGTTNVLAGELVSLNYIGYFAWICPSNASWTIMKSLPLPNDYWGGKSNYVTSWKVRTTIPGSYSFNVGTDSVTTNDLSSGEQQTIVFTAPSTTNTVTISATNTISTANLSCLQTFIYTGNQTQPGNFSIISGKVTAQ
jgi:hypothetical protein